MAVAAGESAAWAILEAQAMGLAAQVAVEEMRGAERAAAAVAARRDQEDEVQAAAAAA